MADTSRLLGAAGAAETVMAERRVMRAGMSWGMLIVEDDLGYMNAGVVAYADHFD